MSQKETIIIVTGANYLGSNAPWFQKIILFFYRKYNVVPKYQKGQEEWIEPLKNQNRDIVYFAWSGGFWPWSVWGASQKLAQLLNKYPSSTIIAVSLGAQVVMNIINKFPSVQKLLLLSGVYRKRRTNIPVVDIQSASDMFCRGFRALFNLFVWRKMQKHDIFLPNVRHDQFHENRIIPSGQFRGKRLSDVINTFLE